MKRPQENKRIVHYKSIEKATREQKNCMLKTSIADNIHKTLCVAIL